MSQRGTLSEVEYLKTLGIAVPPQAVRRAVEMLGRGTSLRAIYYDANAEHHVSKVSATKIRARWEEGKLEDFGGNAQSSVEKDDVHADTVNAQGNPSTEPRVKNAEWFKERFSEVQEAYSGALDRQMREALNIQPNTRPYQSPDPLSLNVVSHALSKSKDRFGEYHLSLVPNMGVNATLYVTVSECVLIIGGEPISEYPPKERALLGEDTWKPYFSVPKWVRPGTYKVCIGALLAKTHGRSPAFRAHIERLGGGGDKYVMSNEFEVSIPVLPKVDAAKVQAKKRAAFSMGV